MGAADGAAAAGGLGDAAQQLLASLIALGRTRLELAAVEIEEERLRLARLMIGAVVALFLLFVAVLLLAAWVVMLFAPADRMAVLGGLGVVFLGAAALAGWRWQRLARNRPGFLQATLAEWRDDGRFLAGSGAAR
jgi:uncharacterized membrane protein YqjE